MNLWLVTTLSVVCATAQLFTSQRLCAQQTMAATRNAEDDARALDELLARRVTISLTHMSRSAAIDSISQVAKVFVQYNAQTLDSYAPITVHAVALPLGVVLGQVLEGTGQQITSNEPRKLMIAPTNGVATRDSTPVVQIIHGRVIDSASGRELSGATIKVGGTKLSGLTQTNGAFTIRNVPVGSYLVTARLFGYRSAERTVTVSSDEPAVVRFGLSVAPNVLAGVVTTATGQQRKIEVGNDITTLNVDSIRQTAPITSVTDLLESRVPGLTVLHTSGTPGDPARLRLRGASSITGNNDPIVIVDGVRVYSAQSDARNANLAPSASRPAASGSGQQHPFAAPSPLDQIDPNSIETIEVQKGPSASALYGSDAANGIIVITTKKGRAGPTHWRTEVATGINYMPGDWPVNYYRFGYGPLSSVAPGGGARRGYEAFCAWNDPSCVVDSVVAFQALNDTRYTTFANQGNDQSASLTVSGGVSAVTYSLTGSGGSTSGILKLPALEEERYQKFYHTAVPGWMRRPDKYTTYGGTGQLTAQPSPTLQVNFTSGLFHSAQRRSSLADGISTLQQQYIFFDQLASTPLIIGEFTKITDEQLSWTNAATLTWQPWSWLPLSATGGLNSIARNDESLLPYGINNTSEGVTGGDTTGYYGIGRGNSLVKTLTVSTVIPLARARIRTAVGFNMTSQSTADFQASTNELSPGVTRPSTFPTTPAAGTVGSPSTLSQSTLAASTYGWYVEPRLNVASRFFVSPGFRLDGGSASGSNGGLFGSGLAGFPKLDLSYVAVDRQDERPLWGLVSFFRPRVSYGYAGTQPGPSEKLRLYAPLTDTINVVSSLGLGIPLALTNIGNTRLLPERASELEAGFDLQLWENRLELTATQYDKVKRDAITQITLPPSVNGFSAIQSVNFGVIRNQGTELTLTTQVVQSRNVAWAVNTNWSHNSNRVVRLRSDFNRGGVGDVRSGDLRIVPGYPLYGRWAYPITGYADVNHDGVLEPNEVQLGDSLVFVGGTDPKYQMALSTDMTLWGRLGIHASLAYTNGLNQFDRGAALSNGNTDQFSSLLNTPGTSLATQAAAVAAMGGLTVVGGGDGSSNIGLIQTVNTLRLQSMSINYNLPVSIVRHLRVPYASVALQGSNLGLHTNYRGKDPNVNAFSTGNEVVDSGQLPEPRTWSLHVTLGN